MIQKGAFKYVWGPLGQVIEVHTKLKIFNTGLRVVSKRFIDTFKFLLDLYKFIQYTVFMTEKQLLLLDFLRNTITHTGRPPTFTAMRQFMGVASNQAVEDWLSILEREGYISRTGKGRRTIKLNNKSMSEKEPALILGKEQIPGIKPHIEIFDSPLNTGSVSSYVLSPQTPQKENSDINNKKIIQFDKGGWEGTA